MKKLYVFLVLLFSLNLNAQDTFTTQDFESLANAIKEIESNGNIFEQKFEQQKSGKPQEIAFEQTTIDKKGKEKRERYEFNLIDMDARLLRREVKSKTMFLTARTDDGQKMIKYFEDGEQENYRSYFSIAVDGVDDYRHLEELLKAAIKKAKKGESQDLSNKSFAEQLQFLNDNIKTVKINDGEYQQELILGEPSYLLDLKIEDATGKNVDAETLKFNLADLLEKSLKISVSGKKLLVKASTQNSKRWIQKYEEGEFKSFGNTLEIVVDNTTEARNITHILKQLIPQAKKLEKERLQNLAGTEDDRLRLIVEYVKDISTSKKDIRQELEGSCVMKYTLTTLESNDKSIISEYAFNLIDFDKKKTAIKTSSSTLSVTIEGKQKLVKYLKEGETQSYRDEVVFLVENIEDAKALAFILEQQIEACQEKNKEVEVGGTAQSLLANCAEFISDIDISTYTYKQKLEAVDQVPCKLQFTQIKSGKSKEVEILYEFNLSDLNPKSIDFSISGKELSVKLYTKNKEKVMKRYLGDEKSDYVDNMEILMADVEQTRKLIALFKALVVACEEE